MSGAFGRSQQRGAPYPKPRGYASGPWSAVMDSPDPSTGGPNLLRDAQNVYPEQADVGTAWMGRPGFTALSVSQQLGDAGRRAAQGFYEFVKLDGTRYRCAIVHGKFYTYSYGTGLFTNIAVGGGCTIDPDAQSVAMLTFANQLIISDGVNTPCAWDGTTWTKLTAAPIFYGKPWVYYDFLFGIKVSERTTIVWSAVADPTIGYEAGGYNNAWTLGQSAQDPLTAGFGLNEVMVVFRARSATSIMGLPGDADFSSQATREGVSETLGTTSPFAVVAFETGVFFLDADARPQRYRKGYGVDLNPPAWTGCRVLSAQLPPAYLFTAVGCYDPQSNHIIFAVPNFGETIPSFCLTADAGNATYSGRWTGFPVNAIGVWTDASGEQLLVHGGPTDGYPYLHGSTQSGIYDDNFVAGAAAIDHILEITPVGYDAKVEKQWDRVDVSLRLNTDVSQVGVSIGTPGGTGSTTQMSFTGGLTEWDAAAAIWDTSVWSAPAAESHGVLGISEQGRWATTRFEHAVLGETIGIIEVAIESFALGTYPATP